MSDNLFEARYDLTKKSRLRQFYESNKISIFAFIFILVILSASLSYYFKSKENKKILLSENYVQAKIYYENGNSLEALNLLKDIIYANDTTYSTLSFFMILNENLIKDYKEILIMFDHLLENNKFDEETRDLLIYKKAVYSSNYIDESELLNVLKPLLSKESIWEPHALLIMGDFFVSKKEYSKAKEFYVEIMSIKNLQPNIYDKAKSQLEFIDNK